MRFKYPIALFIFSISFCNIQAQTCSGAPNFNVNLIGSPAGSWTSPDHSRSGSCCSSNNCTSFDVKLDTGAAMINLEILSGAVPSGALFYKINCGPQIAVGAPICVTGQYTFTITFCKSGNNPNVYKITSIAKPTIPPNPLTVRLGCVNTLTTLGFVPGTVTWQSTSPGAPGAFNYLLSSTTSAAPLYTPTTGLPANIDYQVCGTPQNSICPGSGSSFCGTFTIINVPALTATVTPASPGFCAGGSVPITASASGGAPPYTYIWKDQNNVQVGTGSVYSASVAGTYQVDIRDKVYNASSCPGPLISVPVQVTQPPTAAAGNDQTVCTSSPNAILTSTVTNSSGVVWSGGTGTYSPNATSNPLSYSPGAAEITAGFATLTVTAVALGGGCTNATDVVTIFYPPVLTNPISSYTLACNASTTVIATAASGGTAPLSYSWNTGATTSTISVGEGNYCLTVTDSRGCSAISCSNITVPAALDLTTSATDVTVLLGSDGTATATPTGGTPAYTYLWTPGSQATQTAIGLTSDSYTVLVTDANGCTIGGNIVVNEPTCNTFSISIADSDVDCFGNTIGSATITATGGTPPVGPYIYNWSSGQTTDIITGLAAGVYQVTVTAPNGCIRIESTTITEPPLLTNSMSHTDVPLVGGSNGTATATPSGGNGAYTYLWSNLSTDQTATGLIAGGYTVTVEDANGCTLVDSVRVEEPSCVALVLNLTAGNVSCFNGSDGTANADLLFGTTPYSYVWSVAGQTTSAISALPQGAVSVIVTDAVNCVLSSTITITQPTALTLTLVATDVVCNADNNGTLNLTVAGGTFPYSYAWSNSITVEDQNNLDNGFYAVTVMDAEGCTAVKSATINEPAAISAISSHQNVTCKSGSDGAVNATVSGGIGVYTYLWTNLGTTEDLTGLSTGQYVLSVTDANGCVAPTALNLFINEPDSVDLSSYSITCPVPGSGISKVDVVPIGGDGGPYTVSFDNGATYLSASDYSEFLPVGATYSVFVKDGNDCISSLQPITVNPEPVISNISFANCNPVGIGTATVTITPGGGAGIPYLVSTNNGSTYDLKGDYIDTLAIGNTYQVIIKDTLGCPSLSSTIIVPDSISLSATTSSYVGGYNISCNGFSTGSINLAAAGGTTAYTFLWDNGITTFGSEDLTSIPAGNYTLTITDDNLCSKMLVVPMTEPVVLAATSTVSTNYNGSSVSCFGSTNGAVDLSVSGGTAAYTYGWSNAMNTQDASGLAAGTYSVLVTDKNGCAATNSITLTQPVALTTTIAVSSNYNSQNISCNGYSNGSIDLTVAGGTTNYTYVWSNTPQTTEDITGLNASSYSALVTDLNGCTATNAITLTQPALLTHTIAVSSNYNGQNISCNGLSNGAIDLTISGGTTAYTYLWSNNATTQDISGLNANAYSVLATDVNGCTTTNTITLTEPVALTTTTAISSNYNGQNVSCFGSANGSVNLSVAGGTTAYTYGWSNSLITQDVSGLSAGTYSVLVTDVNGCTATNTIVLTQPIALSNTIAVSSNYNGQNISCNGLSDGSLDFSVTGGTTTYTYLWSNSATTQDISGLSAGIYSVTITDVNGCTKASTITLTQPLAILVTAGVTDVTCNGYSNGSIDVTLNGGTSGYNYTWSNGSSTQDITGITAGNYTVTVVDTNGCSFTMIDSVSQDPLLVLSFLTANAKCYNAFDGEINSILSGGVAPYQYSWSNGATTQNIIGLDAGTYAVMVTDSNSCVINDTIVIAQPDSILAMYSSYLYANGYNVTLNDATDGSIDLTVSGGTLQYSFLWSTGDATEDLSFVPAGNYFVQVTDSNGCVVILTMTLTEPYELQLPTGVSPNADGFNDNFVVHGLESYPDNELKIYNRWGNLVFTQEDYKNDWAGISNNGKDLPEATYFVVLKIFGKDEITLTGYVDLRR